MGITLGSNFTVNTGLPLDDRIVVADNTARDALDAGRRYEGLIVYSIAAASNFQLVGGILNANWVALGGSGSGVTVVADITARDAILSGSRTEGMIVYVNSDDTHYTLKGGILNANWTTLNTALSNISVDSFSGNASTVNFTLTTAPATENNTFVYVNGVYQEKDTYSVSGTTLTFSEAPPIGTTNIEVCYTVPLAIGAPSDDTVSTVKIQNLAVTSAKLADGAVTNAKLAASNYAQSSSIPNVGVTSTSYVAVSGSTITGFVTTGRPLEFGLTAGTTPGNEQEIRVLATGSVDNVFVGFIVYDSTNSVNLAVGKHGNRFSALSSQHIVYIAPGAFRTLVNGLTAGTYNFQLWVNVSSSNSAVFNNVRFYVREL